jgi:hypothetical protein
MGNPRNNTSIEVLKLLEDYLLMYPQIRFCQALYNLDIIDKEDRFYEQSSITLARVRRNLDEY